MSLFRRRSYVPLLLLVQGLLVQALAMPVAAALQAVVLVKAAVLGSTVWGR
jgi:hypothetical protein